MQDSIYMLYKRKQHEAKVKKITNMLRSWGTPQNLFWRLLIKLKNHYLLKKLLIRANENVLFYTCAPKTLTI